MNLPLPSGPTAERDELLERWRHALRSPLNALLAAAEVLACVPADSPAAAEARGVIARQARTLAWLISDIPAGDEAGECAGRCA